jgi:hypothetical protein
MIVITKDRWDNLEERITTTVSTFDTAGPALAEAVMTQLYNWLTTSTAMIGK